MALDFIALSKECTLYKSSITIKTCTVTARRQTSYLLILQLQVGSKSTKAKHKQYDSGRQDLLLTFNLKLALEHSILRKMKSSI